MTDVMDGPYPHEGAIVDYCAIIGREPTQRGMVVRVGPQQLPSGQWVLWLKGKAGCVAVEACVNVRETP
jgi:hypothetical protein